MSYASCCCLYSKGKNFRANHNETVGIKQQNEAVAYIAKVRILEQITTNSKTFFKTFWLLLI